MFVKPTKASKGSIFDVHDDIEPMLYPANDEVPCPWDADITVENGKVIIQGTLGPGGPRGNRCICECLVEDFSKYYKLEINNADDDDILAALASSGWTKA